MTRTDLLDTLYRVIEREDDAINDLLSNCCIKNRANVHVLGEHLDNMKDAICMLDMIGETEIFEKLRGIYNVKIGSTDAVGTTPVIVKKNAT